MRARWMKGFAAGAALCLVSASTFAELTKDEIAAGWINLFDGQTLFGWNSLGDAAFEADAGNIVCESGTGGQLATTSQFKDFKLSLKVRVSPEDSVGIGARAALEGHPSENGTAVLLVSEPKDGKGEWHTVEVEASGDNLSAKVDGKSVPLEGSRPHGYISIHYYGHGFQSPWERRVKLAVSDVKLQPLNLQPIFNGKDLTGWNIIPGRQSVFKVVDGALNITNGNGQIETAGTYKDFVLQLDIISNGQHLNSGVFYRGPVGVFWKGYESQVRNQWQGEDRTKPVDFGTGGNYGNQPARKVVSTDGEWFKKTIVCDGNHAAVWIDGYLASDFTDMRPVHKDNDGKNGYVPGPGTIHLQGHDPKTDLSFKNIVLQEYGK